MGEFYSVHSSLTSVRGRTSAPTLVEMRSPPLSAGMTNTHSLRPESANITETHVFAKLSRCSTTNKSKPPTNIFSCLKIFYYGWINVQPLCSHYCSQESIQALLWRCIFLHWFQYRSGRTSLCHATSADNTRERGTEGKGEGRVVAALATALLSATARF